MWQEGCNGALQLGFPLLGEVRLWWHLSSQGQQGQLRQQEGAEACRPPPRHPKPSDLCRESLSLPWEMLPVTPFLLQPQAWLGICVTLHCLYGGHCPPSPTTGPR